MRKLLALFSVLVSPALAQTPAGVINAPIYATGYISQVGGTNVTTNIPPQPNHPTNLNIYTTGSISGTWTIKLPNPAFEGQVLSFNCGAAAAAITVIVTDGSSLDSSIPTSCIGQSGFTIQFDLRSNIWRLIGSSSNRQITANDVNFTEAGTGSITRTLQSVLTEWHSINSYTTLANALTAAGAGASVVIPYGSYTLPATVLGNGQSIGSMFNDRPNMTYTPNSGSALTLYGNFATVSGMSISQSGTPISTIGVQIGSGEQGQMPTLRDVRLNGFTTAIDGNSNVLRRLDNVNVQLIPSGGTGIRWRNPTSPDSGDDFWSGVTIDGTTPGAGNLVSYESGGGLKVVGFKGLGGDIGYTLS